MVDEHDQKQIARARFLGANDGRIILGVPTDYRIHLAPTRPVDAPLGRLIRGIVRVRAKRIDVCQTGGGYIDPVYGEPRQVQGRILAVGEPTPNTLIVRAAIPMVVEVGAGQRASDFAKGDLITFGVDSGATFEPAPEDGGELTSGEELGATRATVRRPPTGSSIGTPKSLPARARD